ncbi:MAG: hypothetical protein OCC49_04885 [Fibrobacterales bacterium]
MFKAIILLFITIIVTYFAKFHTYSVEPVREHENLGWVLPLSSSLSFLFVAHDDGIDTNNIKTGYRVWFNPPKQPKMLSHGEKAPFLGPTLTLIGDSIELEAIAQVSQTLIDGGVLHIIGRQSAPEVLIKQQSDRILITSEEIYNDTISLPMGGDCSNMIVFDSSGNYTASITNTQYHYTVSNHTKLFTQPLSKPGVDIFLASETSPNPYTGTTVLYRNKLDTSRAQDSTQINLFESDKAVIFYEDKNFGEDRLLMRKIHLNSWRAEGQ